MKRRRRRRRRGVISFRIVQVDDVTKEEVDPAAIQQSGNPSIQQSIVDSNSN